MRSRKGSERKSERLRERRRAGDPSRRGDSDPDSSEPEEQPILVTAPVEETESPRSGRTPQASEYGSEAEAEDLHPEAEHVMTRLKYQRFKGDGSQDPDEWLCEFKSTALANQENEAARQRIFQGVLKGEALKW